MPGGLDPAPHHFVGRAGRFLCEGCRGSEPGSRIVRVDAQKFLRVLDRGGLERRAHRIETPLREELERVSRLPAAHGRARSGQPACLAGTARREYQLALHAIIREFLLDDLHAPSGERLSRSSRSGVDGSAAQGLLPAPAPRSRRGARSGDLGDTLSRNTVGA